MKPIILFRKSLAEENEGEICSRYFDVVESRTDCQNRLVIPRYSALPYYMELEQDINKLGGKLINSYKQHKWIANFEYYSVLKGFTPESWDDLNFQFAPEDKYIVKGRQNSKKFQWNKKMFAPTKRDALNIGCELLQDGLIGEQGIIYRKYVPLKTFEIGLNGLPFTNEYRLFYHKNYCLSYGYYWSSAQDVNHHITPEGLTFAQLVANIAQNYVNFFVLDVAETEEGKWILVEINDGSMSGLSENDPNQLYASLKFVTKE